MRSLSSTVADTPSTCMPSRRVVSNTSTKFAVLELLDVLIVCRFLFWEKQKPPGGRLAAHGVAVRYEIMMMATATRPVLGPKAAVAVAVDITARSLPPKNTVRQCSVKNSKEFPAWHPC